MTFSCGFFAIAHLPLYLELRKSVKVSSSRSDSNVRAYDFKVTYIQKRRIDVCGLYVETSCKRFSKAQLCRGICAICCHQYSSKSSLNLIDIATDTKDDKTLQSVILSVKITNGTGNLYEG